MQAAPGGGTAGTSRKRRWAATASQWAVGLGCLLLGLVATAVVQSPGAVGDVLWRLELTTYDWRLRMRAHRPPSPHIVIIGMDNDSIAQIGQWPWPRRYHAAVVDALRDAGARLIVFDVVFDAPSGPPGEGLNFDDYAFAEAMRRAGNVVLICEIMRELQQRAGVTVAANRVLYPFAPFAKAARAVGVALVPEDVDGVVRKLKLAFECPGAVGGKLPFVGVVAAALARGDDPQHFLSLWERRSFWRHPWMRTGPGLTDAADFLIDYRSPPPGAFEYIPYHAVISGQAPADHIAGKIAFIGMVSGFEPDLKLHPLGSPVGEDNPNWWMRTKMPGVEVIATITDQLLEGRAIFPAPVPVIWLLPALWAAVVGLAVQVLRIRGGFIAALVAAAVHWLAACWSMIVGGVWLPVVAVWGGNALAYVFAATVLWFVQERHAAWLREAWGQRVSPEILQLILSDPDMRHVPGRRRDVSVMFIDLAGSTELSTRIPPDELVSYLNEYLTLATEIIRKHSGTVHKYIGDGILAVFGDPVEIPDHAQKALDAAVEFQRRMDDLRRSMVARGGPPLRARVGIHSGEVVAGDVGPPAMLEYTVIGETVNVAARMESLNKELGSDICVSEATFRRLSNPYNLVFAGAHSVRGMPEPVPVYANLQQDATEQAPAIQAKAGGEP